MAGYRTEFLKGWSSIAIRLPLKRMMALTGQKVVLPVYHLAAHGNVPHVRHLYPIKSPKAFIDDLDFLLKYYQPVDLDQLIRHCDGSQLLNKPSFHLTFDDGLQEFYSVVAPILKTKGVPATNFLNSTFIDNKGLFYRYKISLIIEKLRTEKDPSIFSRIENTLKKKELKFDNLKDGLHKLNHKDEAVIRQITDIINIDFDEFLRTRRPYLTSDQVRELIAQGFTFGAHSLDHPQYDHLTLEDQIVQTQKSVSIICKSFDLKYRCFAFPFTDYGVSRAFFDHFFLGAEKLDLSFGSAGLKVDSYPRHLQRIPMEMGNIAGRQILHGEYLYYLLKSPLGKNRIRRA